MIFLASIFRILHAFPTIPTQIYCGGLANIFAFSVVVIEAKDLIRLMLNPSPKERLVCYVYFGCR